MPAQIHPEVETCEQLSISSSTPNPAMVMSKMKKMRTMMMRRKMEIRKDEEDVPEAANQV